MRYAVINDATGLVDNVILLDPENHCTDHDGPSRTCTKYHGPPGCTLVPAGEGPNTGDPATRPAGPGDRAEHVQVRVGQPKVWRFHPAPKAEPVGPPPDPAAELAALKDKLAELEAKITPA